MHTHVIQVKANCANVHRSKPLKNFSIYSELVKDFACLELTAIRGVGDNDRSDKIKKRIACLTQIASSPHNHHGSHHSATGHYP